MSKLTSGYHEALDRLTGAAEWPRHALARREPPPAPSRNLVIAGVIAVGLGALAWHYLGPDVRRYMKIRSM